MAIKYDFTDKRVVVTGAAQGIGKAVAKLMLEAGAKVAFVGLHFDKVDKTMKELTANGGEAIAIGCDVSNPDDVTAMADKVMEEFGGVDILFNNAGINLHGPAEDMTYKTWTTVINVNLTGIFLVAQAIGRIMIKQGSGSIVNTGSISASIINRPQAQCAYNASKAGVVHLTKSLAMEWLQHGIRVNSVSPGYTATEMSIDVPEAWSSVWKETTPMGRLATTEEVCGAMMHLADDSSSYTTGTDLIVDGGFTSW